MCLYRGFNLTSHLLENRLTSIVWRPAGKAFSACSLRLNQRGNPSTNSEKWLAIIMKIIEGVMGALSLYTFEYLPSPGRGAAVKTGHQDRRLWTWKNIVSKESSLATSGPCWNHYRPVRSKDYAANEILIMYFGKCRRRWQPLSRIITEPTAVQLQPGDTVIFSSSRFLGIQPVANKLINTISEAGVDVGERSTTSIHLDWGQQEQKLMLHRLIEPKYFMPVHGNFGCRRSTRTYA